LSDSFFPDFVQSGKNRLRIWSSACSTGEEPYSIAITLYNALENRLGSIDAKILATDLDTQVVSKAKSAVYSDDRIKDLPKSVKSKWFNPTDSAKKNFSVNEKAKNLITFNKLNLLGPWPIKGKFDVIFCRNVLIYFDRETQEKLVKRFIEVMEPGGILMLGHSESVLKGSTDFQSLGKTIYQRVY
ncbi:MAG: protein-glutamate O-methyltransferase CheR, partial [Pseudomonadota bacterium]